MLPNPQDTKLVKIIKICGIFVFPFIIVALLITIAFVPASKKSNTTQSAKEIDLQIELLQKQKESLSAQ